MISLRSLVALACVTIGPLQAESVRREWVKSFIGEAGANDFANSVAVDAAGDVFTVGLSTNASTGTDVQTVKYSGVDGRVLWEKRASANGATSFGDFGRSVKLDGSGNPVVLGNAEGVYLVKYASSDGRVIWEKTLPRSAEGGPERPRAFTIDAQGNIAVTAQGFGVIAFDPLSGNPYFVYDIYTAKLAGNDGTVLWEQRHAGPGREDDNPYAIAIDGNGNVIVGGESNSESGRFTTGDFYVVKYAAGDGRLVWEKRYSLNSGSFDRVFAIAIDASGNVIATGKSDSDLYTAKYAAADGRLLWERRLTGLNSREGAAVALDASGHPVITGQSYEGNVSVCYTVKYDSSDGRTLWERTHNGGEAAQGLAVVLDGAGDVHVAGNQTPVGRRSDLYLGKYRGSDGAVIWESSYDGPTRSDDLLGSAGALALGPNGSVVLAGHYAKSPNDFDWLTLKFTSSGALLNISTRMRVEAGDNVLIAGFIVTGSQPKKVIIRGLGPSLPVAGALADPVLELDGGAVVNDDWRSTQEGEIVATTIPPSNNQEAAIVATLAPGGHTAILRGKNNGTGVGLVEVYDLEPNAPAQLANISTRGLVQTGDNVMIGGFIVGGASPAKVIVRAIGPSLAQQGVSGALQDPTLELVDSQGNVTSNDDWRTSQEAEVTASTVAPTNNKEAAIVATLVPGNYTAIVRGKNGTTGIALVEGFTL